MTREKKKEFVVYGIELPVRTKTKKVNKERWDTFSQRIEDALNEITENDRSISSYQVFEDHGVLITAHKTPERPKGVLGTIDPESLPPFLRQALMPVPESKKRIQLMMGEALNEWPDGPEPDDKKSSEIIKPIIDRQLASATPEFRRECLDALDEILSEHGETWEHEDDDLCPVLIVGRAIRKELASYIELRVN